MPHLPSLEIREGAIDHIIDTYKQDLQTLGDYLTANGNVNMRRVCMLLEKLGAIEDHVFRERTENEKRYALKQKA